MTTHDSLPHGSTSAPRKRTRRTPSEESFPHGWTRASPPLPASPGARPAVHPPRSWEGTCLLLACTIALLAVVGFMRVRASTEVLELGADLAELTSEHSALLDIKRRLEAERAYLRHPRQLEQVARDELNMQPLDPHSIETIEIPESVTSHGT